MARKLVHCRECGAEISKSVKRCPQCGAKQKKSHFLRNLIILAVLVGGGYYGYNHYSEIKKADVSSAINNAATALSDATNNAASALSDAANNISGKTEKETTAKTTEKKETEKTVSAEADAGTGEDASGVDPDFKEYMDSYEKFMNEYCDFMESYNSADATQLLKYTQLVAEYAEYTSKVDSYNEDNLSTEDYQYFVDVTARVDKRLLEVAGSIE